jgi:hypothetical protein
MAKSDQRVRQESAAAENVAGEPFPETVRVTFESGDSKQTLECRLPGRYTAFWIIITTPEKTIGVHFLDSGHGLEHNVWEWHGDDDTSFRRIEMQFTGCDIHVADYYRAADAKPGMPEK